MSLEHSPVRDGQSLESFVGEKAAAEFLGVSVRTLQRWRVEPPTSGAPCFYKFGKKRVVYRLGDLVEWAKLNCYFSTAEFKPV